MTAWTTQCNGSARLDWLVKNGDFDKSDPLKSAIYQSLFTDISADQSDNSNIRGGWWGHQLTGAFGSKLWLLSGLPNNKSTHQKAVSIVEQSLQWLLNDNIATDLSVSSNYQDGTLTLNITLTRNNSNQNFTIQGNCYNYKWVWQAN